MSNGSCSSSTSKRHIQKNSDELVELGSRFRGVERRTQIRTTLKSNAQDEILLLLSNKPLHGYGIWCSLLEDYPDMRLNTLYRWMNDLEMRGLIEGVLEQGDKGPNRKVYNITQDGKQRVIILARNAVKLLTDIYRRYRLFAALHFSNISQLSELTFSNSRALIAPFTQFHDSDNDIIQILIDSMKGRKIDFIGKIMGISNVHPKPRPMKGTVDSLPVKNDTYGDIWLVGIPKRSSFGSSIEECKRVLTQHGMLYLAIPFLISSSNKGPDLGSFINNTIMHVFPELGLIEFHEVESILNGHFKETGVIELGIPIFWAKK